MTSLKSDVGRLVPSKYERARLNIQALHNNRDRAVRSERPQRAPSTISTGRYSAKGSRGTRYIFSVVDKNRTAQLPGEAMIGWARGSRRPKARCVATAAPRN